MSTVWIIGWMFSLGLVSPMSESWSWLKTLGITTLLVFIWPVMLGIFLGLVVMELKTPKHDSIEICVTKTGKVRIVDDRGRKTPTERMMK